MAHNALFVEDWFDRLFQSVGSFLKESDTEHPYNDFKIKSFQGLVAWENKILCWSGFWLIPDTSSDIKLIKHRQCLSCLVSRDFLSIFPSKRPATVFDQKRTIWTDDIQKLTQDGWNLHSTGPAYLFRKPPKSYICKNLVQIRLDQKDLGHHWYEYILFQGWIRISLELS